MKVSYNIAWEIKNLAAFIYKNLDYSYNGRVFKYNGSESEYINQIIGKIKQLKRKYSWSNKRVFNFLNLVYMQWEDFDNPGDTAMLNEFQSWEDLLRYIDLNMQLQYWPTKELMNKNI